MKKTALLTIIMFVFSLSLNTVASASNNFHEQHSVLSSEISLLGNLSLLDGVDESKLADNDDTQQSSQILNEEDTDVFHNGTTKQVRVTVGALNVRSGPGIGYRVVGIAYRGQVLRVVGETYDWYIVYLPNRVVGFASAKYLQIYPGTTYTPSTPTPSTPTPSTPAPSTPSTPPSTNTGATSEMQEMLNLINSERAKVGAPALQFDSQVNNVAKTKAQDLVSKNYFSHTSPTYGSPFDMLKKFGVSFSTAGENLAGNQSVSAAHQALMNSSGHRANILNPKFNYVGIGIQPGSQYGKIFVQMFIGR